ncbi:MAG: hypothetical protein LH624_19720 [Cryobacterium sp.]|nr:hypothetical protein [Cryobacterium sp.]
MPRKPQPGGVVFEPRSLADNPKKFGRTSTQLATGPMETPHQAAAELQHAVANRIREHLLDQNTNIRTFCATNELPPGLSEDRSQRLLRGETMITITDMLFWARQIPDLAPFIGATLGQLTDPETTDSWRSPAPQEGGA